MLAASNQGVTHQCAAYAMAGCIEYWQWKKKHIKEQVDPGLIYTRAKAIDTLDEPGTTLDAVVNAAVQLNLIPIDLSTVKVVNLNGVKQALHEYGVMLSAFDISQGWEVARADGWIQPSPQNLGGHAVVLIGYSEVEDPPWFAVQNSWGEAGYGWRGFVRMSPQQFADEFQYGLVWDLKS